MSTYHFRALTAAGQIQQGVCEGASEKAVARDLQSQGLVPVYVGASRQGGADGAGIIAKIVGTMEGWLNTSGKRISSRDRLMFTQEVATLLNAGIPLDRALGICSELTESPGFREVIADILRKVRSGSSLAEALESQEGVFSKLFVNMVRAGQASGTLHVVLERMAEFENSAAEFRSSLVSSMIYPVLLTCVALGSIAILMNFVIPRFAEVFQSTGMQMPLPTYLLLQASQLLQRYGWIVIIAMIVGVIYFRRFIRTKEGRNSWHRFQLRVPVVGELLRKAETARFARTMSTLIANSVPLVQSLNIVKEMIGNQIMATSLDAVAQGVKRGEGIAAPVRKTGLFPPLAAHLLTVGEETGRLDAMFERLASIYENETKVAMRRLTALFEPVVILGMGLTVGVIVLSLLLAITSINDVPF